MFDDAKEVKSEDMVELLEELTLTAKPLAEGAAALREDHLSVDLRGKARPADRSRCRGQHAFDARLVRIAPREFTITVAEPLLVGDHYVLSFEQDELAFACDDHAMMRCTGCAESNESTDSYRATLRPFADINLRQVLTRKNPA
tara:strand:- start:15331 stop:15762 length:432 start_codon:yes stop_codon:yes gene_type:complete